MLEWIIKCEGKEKKRKRQIEERTKMCLKHHKNIFLFHRIYAQLPSDIQSDSESTTTDGFVRRTPLGGASTPYNVEAEEMSMESALQLNGNKSKRHNLYVNYIRSHTFSFRR
jgi:hypothetical protein